MKVIFVVGQVIFIINLFIFFILPPIFRIIFYLFPNIDSTENGMGSYPLFFTLFGFASLIVTGPLAFLTSAAYAWYKHRAQE